VWLFSFAPSVPGGPIDQVIEGAKKEGTVSVRLRSGFTPKSMERLEKIIKERFGVDLRIQYAPSSSMSKALAESIMEQRVGAAPTFDLINFSNHVIDANANGILERVDWKPLITPDTNPEVIMSHPAFSGAIIYFTSYSGLMYNPQKVPADKVPRTLQDLADPKWKGKIGINRGTDAWPRWAFVLGKDRVFSSLRALLKNGALLGQYSDLQNRYLLGEIWMAHSISSYMNAANEKGVATKWQCLDLGEVQSYSVSVRKGAKHANAAKLIAVFLASPQGGRFTLEESNAGNLFYPGNYESDIRAQNVKQGIHDLFIERNPQIIDFYSSPEFEKWEKEVDLIMKTGGKS
jgi:iron(III) transport system substrate-binding protein